MPGDEPNQSSDTGRPIGRTRTSWFAPNRLGAGVHPQAWQGWLVIVVPVAAIITVVVLIRTGSL
ncbi:MAG TPA: hypothetical protein VHU90_01645 [Galbitalea sp.]|nr:hypothetical protein [Galbitalea sp.]